jgi:cytochrome b6-f complex iron-sulfur subunit
MKETESPIRSGKGSEDRETSRREFLQRGLSAAGWGTLFVGLGAGTYETGRYFFPSVVFHPPSIYEIGRVEDFLSTEPPDAHGVIAVDSRFKKEHRFFVVRNVNRIYALYARCTHLGCTVNWFPSLRTFKCPCHGSEFHSDGKEFAGPAPRPLDRLKVTLDSKDKILVDTRVIYTAREFEQKKAYIELA